MKDISRGMYLNYATAYPALNRLSEKRGNKDWISAQLTEDSTRFVPVRQTKNLISEGKSPNPVYLSRKDLSSFEVLWETVVLLGEMNGRIYFGAEILLKDEQDSDRLSSLGVFCELKDHAPLLSPVDCGLLAYARLMIGWHRQTRYCGMCGHPTQSMEGGHVLKCSLKTCGKQHFPKIDLAVIVLITKGEECLLARQPWWPEKLYSIIAGFVEPAESIDDAVIREVYEETGLELSRTHYVTSQPWPFPNSIMIGYTAESTSKNFKLDDEELEDARWLSREDIEKEVEEGVLVLPSITSVSYFLIERWFDADNKGLLKNILNKEKI